MTAKSPVFNHILSLLGSQDERICLSTMSQGCKIDVVQQCSIANRIDRSMEKYHRTFYTSKFQQTSSNWMPPIIRKTFETTQELSRIICFILSHFHLHSDSSIHFHIHKVNTFFIFHISPSYSCWTTFIYLFITPSEHCFPYSKILMKSLPTLP